MILIYFIYILRYGLSCDVEQIIQTEAMASNRLWYNENIFIK